MTAHVRRAALADLRDARDAERRGDWRGAHYLRQMVAMQLHFEDVTRRAVGVHRGGRGRWVYMRNLLSFAVGGFGVEADADAALRRYRGLIARRAARVGGLPVDKLMPYTDEEYRRVDMGPPARVGGWADPDTMD